MFPIKDSTPRRSFPFVNYLIILTNIYVFFQQIIAPSFEVFVYNFSFIPSQFNFLDPVSYIFIFTSIFLHGGIFHILSNMWFLHIFGDNLEDRLGHIPYLIFYLIGGFFATMAQYFLNPISQIPMIGASGAISAVAGAYFVFYRHSTVITLVPLFIIWDIIELPVWFFLGYWFFIQVFSGVGSLVEVQHGGVAWFAHIGGFVFGYFLAKIMRRNISAAGGS